MPTLRHLVPTLALAITACSGAISTASAADTTPSTEATLDLIDPDAWATSTDSRMYVTLSKAVFQGEYADNKHMNMVLIVQRSAGEWIPQVAVMPQGLNRGSSSGSIVTGDDQGMRFSVAANIGSDQWVPGDPEASYEITLERNAEGGLGGTFTGTFRGTDLTGTVSVSEQAPGWIGGEDTEAGRFASLNMGNRVGNWNRARWINLLLPTIVDASEFDGFEITIQTDTPRHDATLDIGAMESDGSWYSVRNAVPLSSKTVTARVWFDDLRTAEFTFNDRGTNAGTEGNFDQDPFFDRDRLSRVAIGVVNAHGVGTVEFTVTDVKLARWSDADRSTTANVSVSGQPMSVNAADQIPGGVFGWHVAGGTWSDLAPLRPGSVRTVRAMAFPGVDVRPPQPEHGIDFVVSGMYDRKQLLPQMDRNGANWRERAEAGAQRLGAAAAPLGDKAIVEFWNEPYLDLARMFERHLEKHLTPPEGTQAGDAIVWHGRTLESMVWRQEGDKLVPRDPTRFTYWAGRQTGIFYTELLELTARIARETAPDMQIIGGFGFRWHEDDWISWDLIHKPMIDATVHLIDAVCEHHYQGLPEAIPASYEVLAAYTTTRFDKMLMGVNTEANDLWDAPARGNVAASDQGGKFTSRRRMVYNTRDLLYTVMETPDKALARATHAQWSGARDVRVAADATMAYDRNRTIQVDDLTIVDQISINDETVTAEAGEKLVLVTYQLANTHRRDQSYLPGDSRLHVTIDGDRTVLSPVAMSHTRVRKNKAEVMIPANGTIEGQQVVYRVPAAGLDTAIVQWKPRTRHSQRFHLAGEFAPWQVTPWRHIGINEGEYHAYYALRNLRGRLVASSSSDSDIWSIASIDEQTSQLVTAVWNDSWQPQTVTVEIAAPAGTSFSGEGTSGLLFHRDDGTVGYEEAAIAAAGDTLTVTVELPAAHAQVISLPLNGELPATSAVVRRQYFAGAQDDDNGGVLNRLTPGQSVTLPLPAIPAGGQQAWLRLVVEGVNENEAWVMLGDQRVDLPRTLTQHNSPQIVSLTVDPSWLTDLSELSVHAAGPEVGDGWLCAMASVVVEHPAE